MSLPAADNIYSRAFPDSGKRLAGVRYGETVQAMGKNKFFGDDGLTFKDVVDTVNPLQHIPIVSSIYEAVTEDKASIGAKLIGGALIGGPIGFLAALGNVIFEQETGHSMVGAMVAGLTGGAAADASTQVATAKNEPPHLIGVEPKDEELPVAAAQAVIAPASSTPAEVSAATAQMKVASVQQAMDAQTLSLFGTDTKSAHDSYRKAQFRSYLNDVTTSAVM